MHIDTIMNVVYRSKGCSLHVSSKSFDKCDNFDILNLPVFDGDVMRRPISQLIGFASAGSRN